MADGTMPAEWIGRHAVVALPERLEGAAADEVGDELLSAIADGATVVVADMSATVSCDHAGIGMLSRVYLRASISQAELRLVVDTAAGAELVTGAGLDRLMAVFPSAAAALAAPEQGRQHWQQAVGVPWPPPPIARQNDGSRFGPVNAAVLRGLVDALDDGIVLTADDGAILLVNRQLAAMFGYEQTELIGRPVESLVPGDLREAHRALRLGYELDPEPRPMGQRARLVGARKDGSTVPVTITLSPVPTANGHLVLAVVRDATRASLPGDLASMAWAAADEQDERTQELLGRVVTSVFQVGLSLQAAVSLPATLARERVTAALTDLDAVIHEIRDHTFRLPGSGHRRQ